MSTEVSPDGSGSSITVLRPEDPRHLGPYRLLGVLGSGGMGTVYLGRTPEGENVAVKVVRMDLTGEHEFRERFAREVDAARRVDGSHTAGLVYADPHGRRPWMATTFMLGPSLRETIREAGPLDVATLRALGLGLAEGLTTIHAAGLVHRDLKPGNVLLTEGGPRIIDFGIARAMESTALTSVSQVLGTASYMSPEQVRGLEAGTPSDIFSLGCVLAYAATGNPPFGSGQAEAVAYRVVHTAPDLEGVPAELLMLVHDCLAKDPAGRPTPQQIVRRITDRTSHPVTWRSTPAINTMIATRAKLVRGLETQADAEPTERIPVQHDDRPPGPATGRAATYKVIAAVLAGLVLPLGAWGLYDRLTNPPSAALTPDGWYTITGEPITPEPTPEHWVELSITTPEPGQEVVVGYAAHVVQGGGAPGGTGKSLTTTTTGSENDFLVATPWHGKIPVDTTTLAVAVTAQTQGEVSCAISVDVDRVVEATDTGEASCMTPFEGNDALSENIRTTGATPPSAAPGTPVPTDPGSGTSAGPTAPGDDTGSDGTDDDTAAGLHDGSPAKDDEPRDDEPHDETTTTDDPADGTWAGDGTTGTELSDAQAADPTSETSTRGNQGKGETGAGNGGSGNGEDPGRGSTAVPGASNGRGGANGGRSGGAGAARATGKDPDPVSPHLGKKSMPSGGVTT